MEEKERLEERKANGEGVGAPLYLAVALIAAAVILGVLAFVRYYAIQELRASGGAAVASSVAGEKTPTQQDIYRFIDQREISARAGQCECVFALPGAAVSFRPDGTITTFFEVGRVLPILRRSVGGMLETPVVWSGNGEEGSSYVLLYVRKENITPVPRAVGLNLPPAKPDFRLHPELRLCGPEFWRRE